MRAIAILDEPTNGLDPQASIELLDLIRSLKAQGVSVLLSSHLLDRVQSVCDRVALFNAGQDRADGHGRRARPPGAGRRLCGRGRSRRRHRHRAAAWPRCRACAASRSRRPGRWRLTCDRDLRAEAAAEVVAAGGRLKQLSLDHPSLETIYTRYFQRRAGGAPMRREGSPWQGLGVVDAEGIVRPSHQRAHARAGMAGGADRARRGLRRHPADPRRHRRRPVPVPAPVHHRARSRCRPSSRFSVSWCR